MDSLLNPSEVSAIAPADATGNAYPSQLMQLARKAWKYTMCTRGIAF